MSTLALWRERLGYQGLSLALVALIASSALALAYQLTREPIRRAETQDLIALLAQVLPAGGYDNDLLQDRVSIATAAGPVTVYRARKGGVLTGAVFQTSARGYSGEIQVLLGVDPQGRLSGVRVIRHTETPGLGDKIELAKSDWVRAFEGKSLGDPPPERWAVKKDGGVFDQFTGATITPRATVKAVKEGLVFFAAHREEILK